MALYGLERDAMDGFMASVRRRHASRLHVSPAGGGGGRGHAVAGGAVLALACDARVMGAAAGRFGLNEIRLGVPFPASALEIVRHAVPAGAVEEVLYHGELLRPANGARAGPGHGGRRR